jgi:hypothetical protein
MRRIKTSTEDSWLVESLEGMKAALLGALGDNKQIGSHWLGTELFTWIVSIEAVNTS